MTAAGAARAMHAVPANPRTKRKGGGGRDDYDAVVAKIYKDPRMTRETREIALLLAWLVCRDPNRFNASAWKRAEAILGFRKYGRHTQSVAALLVADDLPRYDPEESGEAICSAPMIRRGGTCGQPAQDHSYTADPETGWRTPVWFCRRHATYGRELNLALADAPEPIPNRGGLLPCYFRLKSGLRGWEQNYKWAAHTADPWLRTEWLPPRYGVAAEGWPHPGRDEVAEVVKPKLQLVALDGELVDEQTPPTEGDQMT
ncbi:hypothetical protein GCM10010390_66300 [Streptomyces mordarskii]|uniref:Uncharacterized protein n=2 Tax=Streptomyces TaxID=1883 RepID=A0ABN1DXL8_9ACTN